MRSYEGTKLVCRVHRRFDSKSGGMIDCGFFRPVDTDGSNGEKGQVETIDQPALLELGAERMKNPNYVPPPRRKRKIASGADDFAFGRVLASVGDDGDKKAAISEAGQAIMTRVYK